MQGCHLLIDGLGILDCSKSLADLLTKLVEHHLGSVSLQRLLPMHGKRCSGVLPL